MRSYPVAVALSLLAFPAISQPPPGPARPAEDCGIGACLCLFDNCANEPDKCPPSDACGPSGPPVSRDMLVPDLANELVDYRGFRQFVNEVEAYRANRLISLEALRKLTDGRRDVLLLDARSAKAFEEGHMAGAVNLPLTDFTAQSLVALIGQDRDRMIIIYCNNNFDEDIEPVQKKLIQVALNTQTFVNLYAYGYENVWELGQKVQLAEPLVRWTGTRAATIPPFETIPSVRPMPENVLPPKTAEQRAGYRPQ